MPALEVLSTRFSTRSAAILAAPTVTWLDLAQKLHADIDGLPLVRVLVRANPSRGRQRLLNRPQLRRLVDATHRPVTERAVSFCIC